MAITALVPTAPRQPVTPLSSLDLLERAGKQAANLPIGPERARAFERSVLPVLADDAAKLLGAAPETLLALLRPAAAAAGRAGADTDQPPRAANLVWPAFAAALGISREDAAAVTRLNQELGALPRAEGRYAPALEQLSRPLRTLAERVSRALAGQQVALSSTERAFMASLVLGNLTWHMTNFQRAAEDATRVDPYARNNVFNTYSDNLRFALERGGLPAVVDMAISDAFNAGKPGVAAPAPSLFTGWQAAASKHLTGELVAHAKVRQRDVY